MSYSQWRTCRQARRQDLAAGGGQKPEEGAKNQKEGPKTRRGGHIFKIQYWMYVATGGPNVKWGGTHFKWGVRAPLAPPLATAFPIGFPAPGNKVSLGAPTQPVHGSKDAKSELGVKGLRKLTRVSHIVVSRPFENLTCRHVFDVRTFETWKSLIVIKLRIQSFRVKPSPLWNVGHGSTFKPLSCDIPNCGNTFEL